MILEGRAALVTGARRVGGTVTVELARRGADVALSYNRSREAAEATAEAVRALGRRAIVRQADPTSAAECKTLVDSVAQDLGRLDVLVNMASTYESVPLEALTPERFQHSLDVELKATLALSLAAIPHMREAGGGRIVNFSDWLAASGRPRYKGYLAYYVAKKAVAGLTEALALELAGDQILVTAVAPGPILAAPRTRRRRVRVGREGHAAGALGRPRRNRQGRPRADRKRLRDRRDRSRGRRTAPALSPPFILPGRSARRPPAPTHLRNRQRLFCFGTHPQAVSNPRSTDQVVHRQRVGRNYPGGRRIASSSGGM